ncbi:hypothetical protein AALP_AA4G092800 [Arabis alpina]|uniref:Uncharacterized protein n=1 Tax=Arabis alpina TaxID=50452 RepID=A0A087H263_ARAAL|nr:hypothetical protein AALP_AA4G092800 [Arabis alpina]
MTDERRIADPKDVAPRDLEEGEIQAEGSTNKDPTARDDSPPAEDEHDTGRTAGERRVAKPSQRDNNRRAQIHRSRRPRTTLEPGLFRKLAARIDPVALNFTTPVGSSSRPRQQNPSTGANDGRSALLAQARRENAKVGDEPIDLDNDDEDLTRRVVPDTIFTETVRDRQGTTKARNDDPRHGASQQFSTFGNDGPVRRVARNTDLSEEELVRRTTTKQKHADPQRATQQRFSAFDDEVDPGYARHISEEEENVEYVKQAEVAEAKQAAIRA